MTLPNGQVEHRRVALERGDFPEVWDLAENLQWIQQRIARER